MSVRDTEINKALAELQTKLPRISKDLRAEVETKTGRKYTYSYADLALISREVLPLLGNAGLSFISRPTMNDDGKFVLAYELRHVSGDVIEGEYPLPTQGTPQEVGSAITYARRYCLCAVTGVAPDDEDHDAIVAEKAARRQRREGQQPKPHTPAQPPMSAEQQKRLQNAFEALGLGPDAKEKRLSYAMRVVGRNLRSATELSHVEAELVITHAEGEAAKAKAGGAA